METSENISFALNAHQFSSKVTSALRDVRGERGLERRRREGEAEQSQGQHQHRIANPGGTLAVLTSRSGPAKDKDQLEDYYLKIMLLSIELLIH